jgi:hypothetical protein
LPTTYLQLARFHFLFDLNQWCRQYCSKDLSTGSKTPTELSIFGAAGYDAGLMEAPQSAATTRDLDGNGR